LIKEKNMRCVICDKKLNKRQERGKTKTCSRSCANKNRYKDVQNDFVCKGCGKKYTRKAKGKSGKSYCSQECGRKCNKGKTFSDKHKKAIAESNTVKNIIVYGVFECDKCGRVFDSNTSIRAHKSSCGQNHKKIEGRCKKCGKKIKGKVSLANHELRCQSEKWNVHMTKMRRKLDDMISSGDIVLNYNTDIELEFKKELERKNIKYIQQYRIKEEGHMYDFYLPKINVIVELDGDYWHGNKNTYSELSDAQKRQFEIDKVLTQKALDGGFLILRFWGSDIKTKLRECMEEVFNYGKSKKHRTNRISRSI
jgi:very-short-patch-repair endonuclease